MTAIKKWHFLVFFFSVLTIIFIGVEFKRPADLFVYLQASAELFSNKNIYNELYGNPAMLFYFGNPIFTSLLYPFSKIPILLATTIWKLLSLLSLLRIIFIIDEWVFKPNLKMNSNLNAIAILCLSSIYYIYSNLHLIQMTIIILFLSLESLNQIFKRNNEIVGGTLLSLALAIKLTPIVFIPYLLFKQKWKTVIALGISILLLIVLPSVFLGWDQNLAMWSNWLEALTPEKEEWAIFDMNNRKNHGLSALLSTLFIAEIEDNVVDLTHRRHLIDLGYDTVKYLIYAARIIIILFTFYFLRRETNSVDSKLKLWWQWSYLFLIITLFFPQQRLYNFIFLMPALGYLTLFQLKQYERIKKISASNIWFLICIITFNLELILGVYRKFYWYHKSTTYATIVLLILLALSLPHKLLEHENKPIKI